MDNKNWHLFSITISELQNLYVLLHLQFKAFLIMGDVIFYRVLNKNLYNFILAEQGKFYVRLQSSLSMLSLPMIIKERKIMSRKYVENMKERKSEIHINKYIYICIYI